MRKKYETKPKETEQYSEPIEVRTRAKPSVSSGREAREALTERPSVPKQLTATELLQQSYNEMKKLRQQEKAEKIARFKSKMF